MKQQLIAFMHRFNGSEKTTGKLKKVNEIPADLIQVTITAQRENNLAVCPHCRAENRIPKTFKLPAAWTCTRKACQQLFKIITN